MKTLLYTESGESIPNLPMIGKEWISVREPKTTKERAETQDFITFYIEKLSNDGWKNDILVKDSVVKVIAADGPTGSLIGFGKISKSTLQVIVLSYERDSKTTCPCKDTYRVFLTNPIPTSLVLENIKE